MRPGFSKQNVIIVMVTSLVPAGRGKSVEWKVLKMWVSHSPSTPQGSSDFTFIALQRKLIARLLSEWLTGLPEFMLPALEREN